MEPEAGFAILRIDAFQDGDESRVSVKRIVWDEDAAQKEVERLNQENLGKGSRYLWQYTRVDPNR